MKRNKFILSKPGKFIKIVIRLTKVHTVNRSEKGPGNLGIILHS